MAFARVLAVGMLAIAAIGVRAEAGPDTQDPMTDDRVSVRTEGSHQLLLPKDWPVEQKDGRFAPAPIEEYISMKFGQVRTRFGQVDVRIENLERQIVQLEKDQRELLKGLKLLEARVPQQEANHGNQEESGEEVGKSTPLER